MELSKERRTENLMRAANMARIQAQQIDQQLNSMSNEELENLISQNPEYEEFLTVGADSDNSGIVVNYEAQPNNQQEQISISPPWEGNLFEGMPGRSGKTNLFELGNPSNNITVGGYNPYGMSPDDERLKAYTPGMRLYGINPYNFTCAEHMVDCFNELEADRKIAADTQYCMTRFYMQFKTVTQEEFDYLESLKFKPADQIVKEQDEALKKQEEERLDNLKNQNGDGNNIIYDMYDANGVRFERAMSFKIIDYKTGDVVKEVNHRKDNNGHSYVTHTQMEDRQRQYEMETERMQVQLHQRKVEAFSRVFRQGYLNRVNQWNQWEAEGIPVWKRYAMIEDSRIDWNKETKKIERALRSASFSRDKFNSILANCCDDCFTYSTSSKFFGLSYDFDRDLHYKALISTPEEMDNDPLVRQKLQQAYEIKRKRFLDKVYSGNLGCQMAMNAHYHPTFAKTAIDELTLDDYKKPENQFMYTKEVTPQLATENLFIPKELSEGAMTQPNVDANGNIQPIQRTMGHVVVDNDTGQVISNEEFDVPVSPPDNRDFENMSDEELLASDTF